MESNDTKPQQNDTPDIVPPDASRIVATPGRVLLCFRAQGWTRNKDINEARPGICVSQFPGCNQNVNVFLDGGNDGEVLKEFRESPQGNTLMSVPIFDALTPEQRRAVASRVGVWCEWPMVPKLAPRTSGPAVDSVEKVLRKLFDNPTLASIDPELAKECKGLLGC